MADRSEATEGELIISIKEALKHEKSKFELRISNAYKLRDIDITFQELNKLVELFVKAKFGGLRQRPKHSLSKLYPMLQHSMICAKTAINRRLCSRMSKLHHWMVVFGPPMPQEVFNLLHQVIPGCTRYRIEVEEEPGSVAITFFNLTRL